MSDLLRVYCPTPAAVATNRPVNQVFETLSDKTIGFIDNAKPNFEHLVEDLAAQFMGRYGIKGVRKHRKPGQVPVDPNALRRLVDECDVIITGSGD